MQLTVWLRNSALRDTFKTCSQFFPNEAGGLLFGYRASTTEFVIEEISGPGPFAKHSPHAFVPDYEHDELLALQKFENSGGNARYLGDWHSHPNKSNSYLSRRDRSALRSILRSEDAQLNSALSMIFSGTHEEGWDPKIWVAELVQTLLVFERISTTPATLKLYD